MADFFLIELDIEALRRIKRHKYQRRDGTTVEVFKLAMCKNKNPGHSTHTVFERKEKGVAHSGQSVIVGRALKYEDDNSGGDTGGYQPAQPAQRGGFAPKTNQFPAAAPHRGHTPPDSGPITQDDIPF